MGIHQDCPVAALGQGFNIMSPNLHSHPESDPLIVTADEDTEV